MSFGNKKEFFKQGIIFSFAFVASFVMFSDKVNAAADAILSYNPSYSTVTNGTDFTVDVVVDPGSHQVNGVSLYANFDQTKLRLDSIGVSGSFPMTLSGPTISNTDGTAVVESGTSMGQYITSEITFATFHFHAIGVGTSSPINIGTSAPSASSVTSDDGTPGDNQLGSVNNGYVTISAVTYTVGGTLSGLGTGKSVVLRNNDGDDLTVNANGSFTFATPLNDNASYAVTVKTQPTGQTCSITSGSGTVSGGNVTGVSVSCADNSGPTFTVNDSVSATSVKTDTINITVSDSAGVASQYYGFSSDSTCDSSDTISTAFTSGADFTISGNHSDYLCVKATNNESAVSYQSVGQLHVDNTAPTISEETASNIDTTSAQITWTTNETADSQIEYGTDASYGSTTLLNTSKVTSHSQNITGLTAYTTYHYRVMSSDVAGNSATSGSDHTFRTASLTQVALPEANPDGGNYDSSQSVTITSSTSDATIYYTTDGTDPTASSSVYSSPITISTDTTLKAFATKSGMNDSGIMTETYSFGGDSDATDISSPKIKINSKSQTFSHSKISYSKNKNFSLKGSDSNLAGGRVIIYKNGNRWKSVDVDSDGSWSSKINVSKNEKYKFKFYYRSAADDDLGSSGTYEVKVDSEDPEFTDLPLTLAKRAGDKVWWTAKDNEKIDHYRYTLNGKITKTDHDYFYMPKLSWGPHVLTVVAYDKAGNDTTKRVLVLVH